MISTGTDCIKHGRKNREKSILSTVFHCFQTEHTGDFKCRVKLPFFQTSLCITRPFSPTCLRWRISRWRISGFNSLSSILATVSSESPCSTYHLMTHLALRYRSVFQNHFYYQNLRAKKGKECIHLSVEKANFSEFVTCTVCSYETFWKFFSRSFREKIKKKQKWRVNLSICQLLAFKINLHLRDKGKTFERLQVEAQLWGALNPSVVTSEHSKIKFGGFKGFFPKTKQRRHKAKWWKFLTYFKQIRFVTKLIIPDEEFFNRNS